MLTYRWVILATAVLAYATSHLTRWSYTGLAPFLAADMHLEKADLGLLGAAFFYPYALVQVWWGRATDRLGGRFVISLGVLGVGLLLGGFATARGLQDALLWRLVIGVVAGCCFVPIASLLAHWFGPAERGFANGAYYGFGGALGEAAAFLLFPLVSIYFLARLDGGMPDWRGATVLMAALIGLVGVVCLVVLRSSPSGTESLTTPAGAQPALERSLSLRDPVLWLLGVYFSAGIIAVRLIPGWLPLYAGELAQQNWGYAREQAAVVGGAMGTLYVIGHVLGSPVAGRLSDVLLSRGVSRVWLAGLCLGIGTAGFAALILPGATPWMLGGLAVLLGVAVHMFPLINAAAAERWGVASAGESLGWINLVGQLAGALSLSVSGYLGSGLVGDATEAASAYRGIWVMGAASCAIGAWAAWAADRRMTGTGSASARCLSR